MRADAKKTPTPSQKSAQKVEERQHLEVQQHPIERLQKTLGNQSVKRLLAQNNSKGERRTARGNCFPGHDC